MNDNARCWIEALESGEFVQTRGMLRGNDDSYCVMGVACEVYRRETGQGAWTSGRSGATGFTIRAWDYNKAVPFDVADWYGLATKNGSYGEGESLMRDNDIGLSFAELAAIIRSEPEGLFRHWEPEAGE